jgi:hypothetical protein
MVRAFRYGLAHLTLSSFRGDSFFFLLPRFVGPIRLMAKEAAAYPLSLTSDSMEKFGAEVRGNRWVYATNPNPPHAL